MRTAVVIPSFRVAAHIADVVRGVSPVVDHVFVVDDRCPEGSGDAAGRAGVPNLTVVRHAANQGVGGATMTGYNAAFAAGFDIAIKMDGDGQMDPAHIPALIAPILAGDADYTKGNRFYRPRYLAGMPFVRVFGNAALSLITKVSSGYWDIMDPTNGYTALHATAAGELDFECISKRYFFESDMLFRLNVARAVVRDVPMPALYGEEQSSLRIGRVLRDFPLLHLRNFLKRFAYNYVVRDFNIGSVEAIFGLLLFLFGVVFGLATWIDAALADRATPIGTVMVATLPIILGFQLLLASLNYDVGNVPARSLQRALGPQKAPPPVPTVSSAGSVSAPSP